MKTLLPLRGIITVLNTPFTEDDRIDLEGLERHLDYALTAGVAGFLVPAMASEVSKLSSEERSLMVRATITAARCKAVVIGGASADDARTRMRLAAECIEAGCDGVLVSIPFTGESEYRKSVQELAALQPPFLMLQDWASDGYGLPVPLIKALFEEIPCFRCLKVETAPAGVKYSEVLRETGGMLHVSGGWAVTQMLEALDRGIHAFMPTGLHHSYIEIFRRYHQGDRPGARALHEQLLPILAFSNQHLDISIHFFKRLLHAQGIYQTAQVREPILPFDEHHERIAAELIERAIALESWAGKPSSDGTVTEQR